MPRYVVTVADEEIQELKVLMQKSRKDYRIKHAQIPLKLNHIPENKTRMYDYIRDACEASHSTIAGITNRFVMGDVLKVYQRPYAPLHPVRAKTAQKMDSVYVRNGVRRFLHDF